MEKARRRLEEMGFTDYQRRAYLALVEHGPMKATDLGARAGISSSKIYDTVQALEELGAIVRVGGKPELIHAVNPATLFNGSLDEIAATTREAIAETRGWELSHKAGSRRATRKPWMATGPAACRILFWDALAMAQKKAVVVCGDNLWGEMVGDKRFLGLAGKVKVSVIALEDSHEALADAATAGAVAHQSKALAQSFIVMDDAVALMLEGESVVGIHGKPVIAALLDMYAEARSKAETVEARPTVPA